MFPKETGYVPACYVMNKGEASAKIALRLTTVSHRFVIRLTGGCGKMSASEARGMVDLFRDAFRGYRGAMIFGGTRMYSRDKYPEVFPGITEIPPAIKADCPEIFLLGIVPRTADLRMDVTLGMVVEDEPENPWVTVIHPDQDCALIIQQSVDTPATWDDEAEESANIIQNLRMYAGMGSLLVSYNGGGVTAREILATARKGWPVLLINGSGRETERYANDADFLREFPNVHVVPKQPSLFRRELNRLGALADEDARVHLGVACG